MFFVGSNKTEITGLTTNGYAMMGWGMWHNRSVGHTTPLFVRVISITDAEHNTAVICCLDTAYVTFAMRDGIINKLQKKFAQLTQQTDNVHLLQTINNFNFNSLVITATHTHSGPAGCSKESLYNVVTPGFVPQHVNAIVEAACSSIISSITSQTQQKVSIASQEFADDVPVAWNRSLHAYNQNRDVTQVSAKNTHKALDRSMHVITCSTHTDDNEDVISALLSLFSVHATCVGNTHSTYNGDNKGYASQATEETLQKSHTDAVAIFAQASAGDISPYFQGKNDIKKRKKISKPQQVAYAQKNGVMQSEKALSIAQDTQQEQLQGTINSAMIYCDFTNITADPKYAQGNTNACTADACIGVSMFEGTRVDGPGMSKALGFFARKIARIVKAKRLKGIGLTNSEKQYYQHLYAAHGNKDILLETATKICLGTPLAQLPLPDFVDPTVASMKYQAKIGAMKHSPMVATVLPLQIVTIGQLALVCCPGEFSTVSGRRIRKQIQEQLAESGITQVLILGYCNEYMGYVTTQEEYQTQLYEGGHTMFGQWTQAAFSTKFEQLAKELTLTQRSEQYYKENAFRPLPILEEELALRTNISPPTKW